MRKYHCTCIYGVNTYFLIVILYTRKGSPSFYFCLVRPRCQPAKLRLAECQRLKLSLLNATVSRRIQNWAKVFASVQGRKLHDAKITPVYSNCRDAFI